MATNQPSNSHQTHLSVGASVGLAVVTTGEAVAGVGDLVGDFVGDGVARTGDGVGGGGVGEEGGEGAGGATIDGAEKRRTRSVRRRMTKNCDSQFHFLAQSRKRAGRMDPDFITLLSLNLWSVQNLNKTPPNTLR